MESRSSGATVEHIKSPLDAIFSCVPTHGTVDSNTDVLEHALMERDVLLFRQRSKSSLQTDLQEEQTSIVDVLQYIKTTTVASRSLRPVTSLNLSEYRVYSQHRSAVVYNS